MTSVLEQRATPARQRALGAVIGGLGAPGTRLLAGPGPDAGCERLDSHEARLGRVDDVDDFTALAALERSGLRGRGGGAFPTAAKLVAARDAVGSDGRRPLIVVNGSESEPASAKDATLCGARPHLVLDGAVVAARLVEASEVVLHLHRGSASRVALESAIVERARAGRRDPTWRLSEGPGRYVAGESSAIVSFLEGGEAKPRFTTLPLARRGAWGRPTVVQNAETLAHVALVARYGAEWWCAGGSPSSPGSRLLTLHGAVRLPRAVVETVGAATVGDVLRSAGVLAPPPAVLIGGYAGTWLSGDRAWDTALDADGLRPFGGRLGCGVVAPLAPDACALTHAAHLAHYLARESAGQCGPCVQGLPELAALVSRLARGSLHRRGLGRIERLSRTIDGRGACSHPDGVVHMVRSVLRATPEDVARHTRGRPCAGSTRPALLPVPVGAGWR
jgi:NADH:ubiquinone oxidoreductase subunit F (NADH-binding)